VGSAVLAATFAAAFTPFGDAVEGLVRRVTGLGTDQIEVTAFPQIDPCLQTWGVPEDQGYRPPLPGSHELDRFVKDVSTMRPWIRAHDAAGLGGLELDVLAGGSSEATVTLLDLRIKIVQRSPAPVMLPLQAECGGQGVTYSLQVPLDRLPVGRPVSVREIYRRWPGESLPAPSDPTDPIEVERAANTKRFHLPMTLSSSDPQVLRIFAMSTASDVRWEAVLVWARAGQESTTTAITFDGKPFRTVGLSR
jgi:hypothetical protein